MRELIAQLAREFVAVYWAVRDAFGEAVAANHEMVQAARLRWKEART